MAEVSDSKIGTLQSDFSNLTIDGYTDPLSVEVGDEIAFHISTNATKHSMEIARVGAVRQVVRTEEDLSGVQYPVPENAPRPELKSGVSARRFTPAMKMYSRTRILMP